MRVLLFALCLFVISGNVSANAQEEHHAHGASSAGHVTAAGASGFGSVHFQTSCKAALAADFNRAVAILHSFEYDEARQAFEEIGQKDPGCAMAKWGESMTYFHGLWGEYDPEGGAKSAAAARQVAEENRQTTEREKGYIAAISEMYTDETAKAAIRMGGGSPFATPPLPAEVRYTEKMAELHRKFPDDQEATIFYALALDISAKRNDKTHADEHRCTDLLNPLFAELPNHPGIAHYIIHCNDNPEMAPAGLEAARKYAQIAPVSAHATHMPAHIFAQLGLWPEMVQSNLVSLRAAEADKNASPCERSGNALHALSFLVIGLAEMGRMTEARQELEHAGRVNSSIPGGAACPDGSHDVKALYVLNTGDWARAREIKPAGVPRPIYKAFLWTAIGAAAANSGDDARAADAERELAALRDAVAQAPGASKQNAVEIFRLIVAGLRAEEAGHKAEAVTQLRAAADLQDRLGSKYVIMKPTREMLGDVLLKNGDAAPALLEYKKVLAEERNRFNSVYGAGSAAFALGDLATARSYYQQLLGFAAGTERRELQIARTRLLETKAQAGR